MTFKEFTSAWMEDGIKVEFLQFLKSEGVSIHDDKTSNDWNGLLAHFLTQPSE